MLRNKAKLLAVLCFQNMIQIQYGGQGSADEESLVPAVRVVQKIGELVPKRQVLQRVEQ
jgi:hypothetical protein